MGYPAKDAHPPGLRPPRRHDAAQYGWFVALGLISLAQLVALAAAVGVVLILAGNLLNLRRAPTVP